MVTSLIVHSSNHDRYGLEDKYYLDWGKCEGKKFTLTLTLTLFITVCQLVTAKGEGVRVKNEKKIFDLYG